MKRFRYQVLSTKLVLLKSASRCGVQGPGVKYIFSPKPVTDSAFEFQFDLFLS